MYDFTEQEKFVVWRKRNGIPLRVVAEYIGCSVSLISYWECGRTNMAEDKVNAYRRFINEFKK